MKPRRPTSVHSPAYKRFLGCLIEARKAAGLTQVDVAKLLGWPQPYVSRCESGERRVDVLELAEFCRVYKKPVHFFFKPLQAKR